MVELVRRRLLEQMGGRFDAAVTLLTAGAGFGKSTLIRHAVRANSLAARGIDVVLTLDDTCTEPAAMAAMIVAALGRPGAHRVHDCPVEAVLDAFRACAPVAVCLIVDDVHRIRCGSEAHHFLAKIVRRLPATGHVLLAGRARLDVALARRWAAGEVALIDEDELRLTGDEVAEMATAAGRRPGSVAAVAGWPALVQLSLAAPEGTSTAFLREEVVANLASPDRRALLAVAAVGRAAPDVVEELVGARVDVGALCERIPLLSRDGDGRAVAHELWTDALPQLFGATEIASVRRRAARRLCRDRDYLAAGTLAAAAGDGDTLRCCARELVRTTVSLLPVDTAERWLRSAPGDLRDTSELRLLRAAVDQARGGRAADVGAAVEAVRAACADVGDVPTEIAALAFGSFVALITGDRRRCWANSQRIGALPGADADPTLRALQAVVSAFLAEMHGDVELALRTIAGVVGDPAATPLATITARVYVNLLVLAGRAGEAVPIAARDLASAENAHARMTAAFVRWQAGDPRPLLEAPAARCTGDVHAVDRFRTDAFGAVVRASIGDIDGVETALDRLPEVSATTDFREAVLVTHARVVGHVLRHDEAAAATALDELRRRFADHAALAELHLRRFLALGYVLDPELRARWRAAQLGPEHRRAATVAEALLDARDGRADRPGPIDPHAVLTTVPLTWSVELALAWRRDGHDEGRALLAVLASSCRGALLTELEHVAGCDHPLAVAADEARRELTRPSAPTAHVRVLGPLAVELDGTSSGDPALRRARVRQLLSLLVVRRTARREYLMDRLWPDLDAPAQAANLRVTLHHLRRALAASDGAEPGPIRADADAVTLTETPSWSVDAWVAERALGDARRAAGAGDTVAWRRALETAVANWRGEPLPDLRDVAGEDGHGPALQLALADAALALGEHALTEGDDEAARGCAERVLAADPYAERAHRLAIAVHLHRADRSRLGAAVRRLRAVLDDLDVRPEEPTAMLLRLAATR